MTRSWRKPRARNATNVRVERSAQCMSSSASTSASRRLNRSISSSSASNRRSCPEPSAGVPALVSAASLRPGRSAPSCTRVAGVSSARTEALSRTRGLSALSRGAYGSSPSPCSTPSPRSTRAPEPPRRCSNSVISRVLPTPESPPTRTTTGRPLAASRHASSSSASSPTRPTKWLLVSRARMIEVSPEEPPSEGNARPETVHVGSLFGRRAGALRNGRRRRLR